jgi:high-affinity iron transporter
MLQAFIVTLREGVEAALIIGIVFAYLNKIGRNELKKTVFWGLGTAVLASILTAVLIAKLEVNTDIFEGWVMLLAAFFVVSMIWVMHKAAKGLKGEIEGKISQLAASPSAKVGLFFFVFLMVLREGVETVLILAAVSLNSSELMSFMGTLLGLGVSVVFGVMFARGSLRVNLGRFFKITTVILYFVAFQLIVSGLHELSENGVLPSNKAEMQLIGPIVRNDLFFFITMLALAGIMMLMEYKRRNGVAIDATATAADRRKAEWSARRERMWMTAVCAASFLFIVLTTAEFIYAKSTTSLSPAKAVVLTGSQVAVPLAEVNDDQLHRYSVVVDTDSGARTVRFLLYRKPDGNVVSVADACQICGPVGFFIGPQGITCKMCASPLVPQSMGQAGGCNPVPLKSSQAGGEVMIAGSDLRTLAARFGA